MPLFDIRTMQRALVDEPTTAKSSRTPRFDVRTMPSAPFGRPYGELLADAAVVRPHCWSAFLAGDASGQRWIWLIFAGLALPLSAAGMYGVLAHTVTQRTPEFRHPDALGAGARDLLCIVVGHGVKLVAVGLAVGAAVAFVWPFLLAAMLYRVEPADPLMFFSTAAALLLVALIASQLPSVRALAARGENRRQSELSTVRERVLLITGWRLGTVSSVPAFRHALPGVRPAVATRHE